MLSVMFVGQVMVYGDGNSQGIAHAETIGAIKESLQLSENADELQKNLKMLLTVWGKSTTLLRRNPAS